MKRCDLLKAVALSAAAGSALWRTLAPVSGETPAAEATPVANVASLLLVRWELEAVLRADGSTLIAETPADHTI